MQQLKNKQPRSSFVAQQFMDLVLSVSGLGHHCCMTSIPGQGDSTCCGHSKKKKKKLENGKGLEYTPHLKG